MSKMRTNPTAVNRHDHGVSHVALHPQFGETDFVSLPNYNMHLRLMIEGEVSRPFSPITLIHPSEQ
jgi:hypothetical protein